MQPEVMQLGFMWPGFMWLGVIVLSFFLSSTAVYGYGAWDEALEHHHTAAQLRDIITVFEANLTRARNANAAHPDYMQDLERHLEQLHLLLQNLEEAALTPAAGSSYAAVSATPLPLSPVGNAFRVHTATEGDQSYPRSTPLADGGMLVVFWRQLESAAEITAQRYDRNGNPLGSALPIAQVTGSSLFHPAATSLSHGGFAIAWTDDETNHARVRSYDANSRLISDVLSPLPPHSRGAVLASPQFFSLTALSNGAFALTWNAGYAGFLGSYSGASALFTQTFGATGSAMGAARQITPWVSAATAATMTYAMDSASLSNGNYIVLIRAGTEHPDNPENRPVLLGRIFNASAAAVTDHFLINPNPDAIADRASLASLADGSFVVLWLQGDYPYWRRFSAMGVPLNNAQILFEDAPRRYNGTNPAVNALPDGGFVITLRERGSTTERLPAWAQRYNAAGLPIGELSQLGRAADFGMTNLARQVEVVPLGGGAIFSVWELDSHSVGRKLFIQPLAPNRP